MEDKKDTLELLDLMIRPGFCVKENKIVKVNRAAEGLFLTPGLDIQALILSGKEAYDGLSAGCLYLTLSAGGATYGASVIRVDDMDVFVLDQEPSGELQAMALAARELRKPMDSLMRTTEQLLNQTDPSTREQATRLNRGLYQLLRIIGNMSDAGQTLSVSYPEMRDIGGIMAGIFEKAQTLLTDTGIRLTYEGLSESIYCLVDEEQLERAVLNILSNAIKFSPRDGTIKAHFIRQGRMLRLSIQDSGSGIAEDVLRSVFHRYLRQPSIEDGRFGIGLGMVMIRSAAAHHGGAVLIDQPEGKGTRITMTLAIRQNSDNVLRSPVLRPDYAGGRDRMLLGLSENLPHSLYNGTK